MTDGKELASGEKQTKKVILKKTKIQETEERQTINAKYDFTPQERKIMADKLAQRQIELIEAGDEKKTAVATFADRIKRIQLDISKLSRGYRDGWEFRDHEVTVVFDYGKKEKRYRDVNTKKIVHSVPFGPGDEQRRFA